MTPDPLRARRENVLTLTILGSNGRPLDGATVEASMAMTAMDLGTSRPVFSDLGAGRYRASVTFSMPGPWRVRVTGTPPLGGTPTTRALDYSVGQ